MDDRPAWDDSAFSEVWEGELPGIPVPSQGSPEPSRAIVLPGVANQSSSVEESSSSSQSLNDTVIVMGEEGEPGRILGPRNPEASYTPGNHLAILTGGFSSQRPWMLGSMRDFFTPNKLEGLFRTGAPLGPMHAGENVPHPGPISRMNESGQSQTESEDPVGAPRAVDTSLIIQRDLAHEPITLPTSLVPRPTSLPILSPEEIKEEGENTSTGVDSPSLTQTNPWFPEDSRELIERNFSTSQSPPDLPRRLMTPPRMTSTLELARYNRHAPGIFSEANVSPVRPSNDHGQQLKKGESRNVESPMEELGEFLVVDPIKEEGNEDEDEEGERGCEDGMDERKGEEKVKDQEREDIKTLESPKDYSTQEESIEGSRAQLSIPLSPTTSDPSPIGTITASAGRRPLQYGKISQSGGHGELPSSGNKRPNIPFHRKPINKDIPSLGLPTPSSQSNIRESPDLEPLEKPSLLVPPEHPVQTSTLHPKATSPTGPFPRPSLSALSPTKQEGVDEEALLLHFAENIAPHRKKGVPYDREESARRSRQFLQMLHQAALESGLPGLAGLEVGSRDQVDLAGAASELEAQLVEAALSAAAAGQLDPAFASLPLVSSLSAPGDSQLISGRNIPSLGTFVEVEPPQGSTSPEMNRVPVPSEYPPTPGHTGDTEEHDVPKDEPKFRHPPPLPPLIPNEVLDAHPHHPSVTGPATSDEMSQRSPQSAHLSPGPSHAIPEPVLDFLHHFNTRPNDAPLRNSSTGSSEGKSWRGSGALAMHPSSSSTHAPSLDGSQNDSTPQEDTFIYRGSMRNVGLPFLEAESSRVPELQEGSDLRDGILFTPSPLNDSTTPPSAMESTSSSLAPSMSVVCSTMRADRPGASGVSPRGMGMKGAPSSTPTPITPGPPFLSVYPALNDQRDEGVAREEGLIGGAFPPRPSHPMRVQTEPLSYFPSPDMDSLEREGQGQERLGIGRPGNITWRDISSREGDHSMITREGWEEARPLGKPSFTPSSLSGSASANHAGQGLVLPKAYDSMTRHRLSSLVQHFQASPLGEGDEKRLGYGMEGSMGEAQEGGRIEAGRWSMDGGGAQSNWRDGGISIKDHWNSGYPRFPMEAARRMEERRSVQPRGTTPPHPTSSPPLRPHSIHPLLPDTLIHRGAHPSFIPRGMDRKVQSTERNSGMITLDDKHNGSSRGFTNEEAPDLGVPAYMAKSISEPTKTRLSETSQGTTDVSSAKEDSRKGGSWRSEGRAHPISHVDRTSLGGFQLPPRQQGVLQEVVKRSEGAKPLAQSRIPSVTSEASSMLFRISSVTPHQPATASRAPSLSSMISSASGSQGGHNVDFLSAQGFKALMNESKMDTTLRTIHSGAPANALASPNEVMSNEKGDASSISKEEFIFPPRERSGKQGRRPEGSRNEEERLEEAWKGSMDGTEKWNNSTIPVPMSPSVRMPHPPPSSPPLEKPSVRVTELKVTKARSMEMGEEREEEGQEGTEGDLSDLMNDLDNLTALEEMVRPAPSAQLGHFPFQSTSPPSWSTPDHGGGDVGEEKRRSRMDKDENASQRILPPTSPFSSSEDLPKGGTTEYGTGTGEMIGLSNRGPISSLGLSTSHISSSVMNLREGILRPKPRNRMLDLSRQQTPAHLYARSSSGLAHPSPQRAAVPTPPLLGAGSKGNPQEQKEAVTKSVKESLESKEMSAESAKMMSKSPCQEKMKDPITEEKSDAYFLIPPASSTSISHQEGSTASPSQARKKRHEEKEKDEDHPRRMNEKEFNGSERHGLYRPQKGKSKDSTPLSPPLHPHPPIDHLNPPSIFVVAEGKGSTEELSNVQGGEEDDKSVGMEKQYAEEKKNNPLLHIMKKLCIPQPWEKLRHLSIPNQGLKSLLGLASLAPALITADLHGNHLTSVNGLPETLVELNISKNFFTECTSLAALYNLLKLDLSQNKLHGLDLELSRLEQLEELDVSKNENPLQGFRGILHHTRLSVLKVAFCGIKSFPLEDMAFGPSLRILDLSSNELHSLNGLGQCYALERLNLDKNHLNTLSLTAVLPRLTHLYLSFNPTLNHLDLSLLPALERLRVDGNDLWRLSGLSKSSKLRSLSCRGQEGGMLRLGPLSLPRIRSLYLSGNPLYKVPLFLGHDKDAKSLEHLTLLELSACSLSRLSSRFSSHFPHLRVLNLNHNGLSDPTPLLGLRSLSRLFLLGNRFDQMAGLIRLVKSLPELSHLDLRYNPVSMRYYAPTHMGKEGMVCFSPSPYLQDPEWQKEDETFRNSLTDTRLVQRVTYRNALIRVGKSLSVLDGFSITQEDKDQALEFLQWLAQPGEEGEEGRQMKREKGKEKDRITGSFDPSPMNLSFRNSFTRPGLSSSASTVGASPRLGRSSQSSSRENPSSARMSHRSSDATSSSPARASHRPSNSVSESQRAPLSPST